MLMPIGQSSLRVRLASSTSQIGHQRLKIVINKPSAMMVTDVADGLLMTILRR